MDYFTFEPEIFPTSLEFREIKQMLLSGEKIKIMQSVEKIKKFFINENSVSEILKSDICEFICDAVLPLDSSIVSSLYNCIENLASHVEFYTHNHSCYTIESIIRTLHFLMKDSGNMNSLTQCLHLLNVIAKGYSIHSVTPESKTTENLLHLLPTLVNNLPPTIHYKYYVGTYILNIMDLGMPTWSLEIFENILNNFTSWFKILIKIFESEPSITEKLILLCCKLSCVTLRYLISNESVLEEPSFDLNENLKNNTISVVIEFLINVGAPYFEKISFKSLGDDTSSLENFFQIILCFYNDEMTFEKKRLIHGLTEAGFIQFTSRIICFADLDSSQKLRKLCFLVLFYVILSLSDDVFIFPDDWENGRDDFRSEVQTGITQLPINPADWLSVLVSSEASFSSKLAILLYLYFYSLTARSQDILQSIYPAVVNFIRTTEGIETSVLLMKVTWFIFVMSQLSVSQNSCLKNEIEATNEMVSLLEAQLNLSSVYTHHPALLYWVFSTKVSSNIQTQTVHLWLRNKTPDCKELDELMKKSSDVRFTILDIIQNGWGQELDSAFSSLKSLLQNNSEDFDSLATNTWYLLPQVLAKFTADSASVMNADYMIELCSLRAPPSLDIPRIIRISSLLPEALLKSDLISIVPSLSLAAQLVKLGLQMNDHRVLSVFLRHDEFLQKILEGLNANVSDITIQSIRIMKLLWKECKDLKSLEKRKKIKLSKITVLKVLETDCEDVLLEGLDFLQEILQSQFKSPVFDIAEVDSDFVEILFQNIQDICVKTSINISKRCWTSLKLFLQMENESYQCELLSNPLLHELILLYIPHLNDSNELKEFLTVWSDLYKVKINDCCFKRKISGWFFEETIERIQKKIMKNCKPEDQIILGELNKSVSVLPEEKQNK